MSKKFKYSIFANFNNVNTADQFIEDLEVLGYKDREKNYLEENSIQIRINSTKDHCSEVKNGHYHIDITDSSCPSNVRDFTFNIDNKWEYEAALAIAAIVDDNNPYVGEWVVSNSRHFRQKDGIYKIAKTSGLLFNTEDYVPHGTTYEVDLTSIYARKATPEEIIEFFKNKYMKREKQSFAIKGPINMYPDLVAFFATKEGAWKCNRGNNSYHYEYNLEDDTQNWWQNPGNVRFPIISYLEWKEMYGEEIKEEKVPTLPEKWCIEGPISQYEDLLNYLRKISGNNDLQGTGGVSGKWYYLSCKNHRGFIGTDIKTGELITYEQWKEWYDYNNKTKTETMQLPEVWAIKTNSRQESREIYNEVQKLFPLISKSQEGNANGGCYYIKLSCGNFQCRVNAPANATVYNNIQEWKKVFNPETINMKERKMIGYKLIKDYPGAPVMPQAIMYANGSSYVGYLNHYRNIEFWEPVYEEEKKEIIIEVKCDSTFKVTVVKGDTIICPEGNISIGMLRDIKKLVNSAKLNHWDFSINSVNIGCKNNIPFKYLDEIIKAWEEINS